MNADTALDPPDESDLPSPPQASTSVGLAAASMTANGAGGHLPQTIPGSAHEISLAAATRTTGMPIPVGGGMAGNVVRAGTASGTAGTRSGNVCGGGGVANPPNTPLHQSLSGRKMGFAVSDTLRH